MFTPIPKPRKPRHIPAWLYRLWLRVREPRFITIVSGVYWLGFVLMGVAAFIAPPQSIAAELGPIRTEMWASFLLVGGVLGFTGCCLLTPVWWRWVEHAGMIATTGGLALYITVVMTLHYTQTGSRLTQALGLVGLVVGLLLRWALARWLYAHGPYAHHTGSRHRAN